LLLLQLMSVFDSEVTATKARKSKSGTNKARKTSTAAPRKRTKKKAPAPSPIDDTESSALPPPVQEDPLLPKLKTPVVATRERAEDVSGVVDGTASGKHNAGGEKRARGEETVAAGDGPRKKAKTAKCTDPPVRSSRRYVYVIPATLFQLTQHRISGFNRMDISTRM
jgi:hypothetical protein